jgi:predicted RNA-binding Zn ribbon-like protein
MSQAKAPPSSDWIDGFIFIGNHPALDFLNTRPLINGEFVEFLPDFAALLRWFQAAGLLSSRDAKRLGKEWGESPRARRTLEAMRELREKLRKGVLGWEQGGTLHHAAIDELNRLLAEHPMKTALKASGKAHSTELWFEARQPEDLFAPLAQHIATLFAHANRSRVRKCDQCILHFLDTSKKGTRRWCSMNMCGNRMKVAAYAARQRAQGQR